MTRVVDLVRAATAPVTHTRLFRALAPVLLPPIEAVVRRLSGGRVQISSLLVPSLVLTTTGAKTGQKRDTELMYCPDGSGRAIVAGTSFARARHPSWTYNLQAHPDAEISVRDKRFGVRAVLIPAAQREEAWNRIEAQWPGYRGYERDSGRVVRLFRLELLRALEPLHTVEPLRNLER